MIIDDYVFKEQMRHLDGKSHNPVHFNYKAEFIDENHNLFDVHNVMAIKQMSDYDKRSADYLFVTVQLYKSVYFKLLKTNRRLLQLRLIRFPTDIHGRATHDDITTIDVFNAYLTDNTSEALETRSGKLTGTHVDDLGELVEVSVQLIERGLSEFRLWSVGGVYRNVKIDDTVKVLLSQPIQTLNGQMTDKYSVTMVTPDNQERLYQMLIPNDVKLVDIAGYIQHIWGIYSAGLGCYLYRGMWYVYPLFDVKRYDKERKRATIINVPRNEMMGVTNTYTKELDELYIYATGDTKHIDNADRLLDGSGGGFRAVKTANLRDHFAESAKGVTEVPSGQNYMAVNFEQRPGDMMNMQAVPGMVTSNVWEASSKIIAKMGNIIVLNWEHSNPSLLYPGMPIRMLYKYLDTAYSIFGTILRVHTDIATPMSSALDTQYKSNTVLTLYCERATQ